MIRAKREGEREWTEERERQKREEKKRFSFFSHEEGTWMDGEREASTHIAENKSRRASGGDEPPAAVVIEEEEEEKGWNEKSRYLP